MRHARVLCLALALIAAMSGAAELAHAAVWPTTVARVERGLESADPVVRREAAQHLAEIPLSRVRQILPLVLKDPDPQVRVAAGRAAIRSGFDAKLQAEVWLSDADPTVRQVAAEMLGAGVVSPGAVTALARTLSDPVPAVRLEAAKALANAPADDGARVLLNHLDDAQEAFALAVVDSLATLRSVSAVVPLVGKVQDPRVNVRRAVVRALGEFEGSTQVVMPLVLALADSDPEVRRVAIESIVAARAFDTMTALEERVRRDRDVDVQVAALEALLALSELAPNSPARQQAVALAVECLSHERQELRSGALTGLSDHAATARAELRECLTAASGEIVGRCALALAHAHDPENTELLVAAWRQGRILAPDLLAALSIQQGDQALLLVLEMLNSDVPAIRGHATEVVGTLLDAQRGDGRAVEPVVEALRKAKTLADVEVLLDLLGRTGSPRAVKHVLPFLDASGPVSMRITAVRALGQIQGARVPVTIVEALLTNEDAALRMATTSALREGQWQGVAGLLLRLLADARLDEAESLAVALWGPAKHVRERAAMSQFEALIEQADGRLRDALLEALAQVPWDVSNPVWQRLLGRKSCATQAKVAEVLGSFPQAVPLLAPMLSSNCPTVQANAVWAIGYHGETSLVPRVQLLVGHPDRAVSGNAVATLARIAARGSNGARVASALCEQVHLATLGSNAGRAANALFGLRSIGQRCGDGADERTLLSSSTSPQVRVQAAWLLHAVAGAEDLDRKALERCVRYDVDGEVASACITPRDWSYPTSAERAATVMVVAATQSKPQPSMPFSLLTEFGAYRFGSTDARGAVWMWTTSSDALSLRSPVGQW